MSETDWFLVSCSDKQHDEEAAKFVGNLQWLAALFDGEYRIACVAPGEPFFEKI
jgi:hypothetical protein